MCVCVLCVCVMLVYVCMCVHSPITSIYLRSLSLALSLSHTHTHTHTHAHTHTRRHNNAHIDDSSAVIRVQIPLFLSKSLEIGLLVDFIGQLRQSLNGNRIRWVAVHGYDM